MYEKIFGKTYVSTGGESTTKRFFSELSAPGLQVTIKQLLKKWSRIVIKVILQPGQKVLDVGCGIGGSAFFMAKNFGVDVYGMDLSTNMIEIANDLRYEIFDYDMVWSHYKVI